MVEPENSPTPKKSLGQHWLNDETSLIEIVKAAEIEPSDFVLEIGPGLGSLTQLLVKVAGQVIAVEVDKDLASSLYDGLVAGNLEVVNDDIRKFNLDSMPVGYKVVGNIPYFLTGHLLRLLVDAPNKPKTITLLVQKEVAERVAAHPGEMSIIAASTQLFYEARLGKIIHGILFEPQPKVDSQILILKKRPKPLFEDIEPKKFLRLVKAGFSSPRKKLRSSLAAGLRISVTKADDLLEAGEINGDLRAEALSLEQWHQLYTQFMIKKDLHSLLH